MEEDQIAKGGLYDDDDNSSDDEQKQSKKKPADNKKQFQVRMSDQELGDDDLQLSGDEQPMMLMPGGLEGDEDMMLDDDDPQP